MYITTVQFEQFWKLLRKKKKIKQLQCVKYVLMSKNENRENQLSKLFSYV